MSKVCFRLGKIWQVVFRPEGFLEVSFQAWGCVVSWGSTSFQRVQNSAARLIVRALPRVHITPVLRHLHRLPVWARISYKTACLCFNAITSSTPAYLSDILHLYSPRSLAPMPTPASSNFHSISARQKVIVLSLTLVLLSGTHCHWTLEILQISTPSSLL